MRAICRKTRHRHHEKHLNPCRIRHGKHRERRHGGHQSRQVGECFIRGRISFLCARPARRRRYYSLSIILNRTICVLETLKFLVTGDFSYTA